MLHHLEDADAAREAWVAIDAYAELLFTFVVQVRKNRDLLCHDRALWNQLAHEKLPCSKAIRAMVRARQAKSQHHQVNDCCLRSGSTSIQ